MQRNMRSSKMTLPVNYAETLAPLYPDFRLQSGTLFMKYLADSGAEVPKRFIFDESLLENDKVRSLNIRTVLKSLEYIFSYDFYQKIDYKNPDYNKISYLCLQAGTYLTTQDPQLREQVLLNLDYIDSVAPPDEPQPERSQDYAAYQPETQQYFGDEYGRGDCETWSHQDLVNYVALLESNNLELTQKVESFQNYLTDLQKQLKVYYEIEKRMNFVPEVIRAGKDDKKRWFIF